MPLQLRFWFLLPDLRRFAFFFRFRRWSWSYPWRHSVSSWFLFPFWAADFLPEVIFGFLQWLDFWRRFQHFFVLLSVRSFPSVILVPFPFAFWWHCGQFWFRTSALRIWIHKIRLWKRVHFHPFTSTLKLFFWACSFLYLARYCSFGTVHFRWPASRFLPFFRFWGS